MQGSAQQPPGRPATPGTQPGEPDRWYGRFQLFLGRAHVHDLQTYRKASNHPHNHGSSAWTDHAQQWHWRLRAQAWDEHQRELLALSEHNRRRGAAPPACDGD